MTYPKQFRKLLLVAVASIAIAFLGASVSATATAAQGESVATVSLSAKTKKQLTAKSKKQAKAKAKKACKKKRGKAKRNCIRVKSKTLQKRIFKQLVRKLPGKPAPKAKGKAAFKVRGSVGDAYVLGAAENDQLMLVNADDRIVRTGKADSFGSKVFYAVKPAAGYTVRVKKNGKVLGTSKFSVLKPDANPSQSFYKSADHKLNPGLNFIKMRDGVELAMTVQIPPGPKPAGGWPVVIEHSGYGTAAPHPLFPGILTNPSDPLLPDTSTAVGGLIAPQMKFASVMVQMRGTGCSGGAFDLFNLPTTYDGYDMVETVANQSWSSGKVGMVGISYSGISQLFAAGTKPPHLAAITPMSPTTDLYSGTGYPGGIFNKGFALGWLTDRVQNAEPAPGSGQNWAKIMSTTGDPLVAEPLRTEQKNHCLDNQKLRLQTQNIFNLIKDNPYRTPSLFNNRTPGDWLAKSKVPTFFVGSFQDEQTGGQFAEALDSLKKNPNVWMALQNGVHVDSLSPSVITDWGDFLNLFVADRIPEMPTLLVSLGGELYGQLADAPAIPIQESKYKTYTSVAKAKADFIRDTPRLRLLMDNGAATVQGADDPNPGQPAPGGLGAKWEIGLKDYPVPGTKATTYYLGDNGALASGKPSASTEQYTADPSARPKQTLPGSGEGDAWKAQPPYNWAPVAAGKGLGFVSQAFTENTLMAGPSSLDLRLKSNKADTDIQVAITEVRPDGNETYVQSGWLRASHRKLDPKRSTALEPTPTHLKQDGAKLPAGKFSEVRVPIFPVAHMFRTGSKIRVTITATGGDRPRWDFDTVDDGTAVNTIQLGGATPSKLVLPIIPTATWNAGGSVTVPSLPAPTALRGEPNRTYEAASNGG